MTKKKSEKTKKEKAEVVGTIKTIKQTVSLKRGNYTVFIEKTPGTCRILNKNTHNNFVFQSEMTPATLKRWRAVLNLMIEAIDYLELK